MTQPTNHTEQPLPIPNSNPSIQMLVRRDLAEREKLDIDRYGSVLQAGNGRDALRDAYEEAMDLTCYLKQAMEEKAARASTEVGRPFSARQAYPQVRVVGYTHPNSQNMANASDGKFFGEGNEGQDLAEFAGRACYQSWSKPNPKTATNEGYLAHILEVGHYSVLEHGSVSFYLTGVSRSFTHELVRHRHLSFSQLSQRYVDESDARFVVPHAIAKNADALARFWQAADASLAAYRELYDELISDAFAAQPIGSKTEQRKAARQAARSVLPNSVETRIVVTGNYRAWRHFIDLRATEHADVEIRQVAILILREMLLVAPNVFMDYVITELPDGTETAASPHREES